MPDRISLLLLLILGLLTVVFALISICIFGTGNYRLQQLIRTF